MRIINLQVRNFRCLREVTLDFNNITTLMGRNGCGKSSIIQAIGAFYDLSFTAKEEDYYNRDISNNLEITITFCDLMPNEIELFNSYIFDGRFTVTKKFTLNAQGKFYSTTLQIPEFADLLGIQNKTNRRQKYNELRGNPSFSDLPAVSSNEQLEDAIAAFSRTHPELQERIESTIQLKGATNIGGGSIDNFTKYIIVPAVKDVSDELVAKGNSYIQQLLELAVMKKVNARDDIKRFKDEFAQKIREIYSSDNLTELPQVGGEITEILNRYVSDAAFYLEWGEVALPDVKLPAPIATITEDGFRGQISRKGHGLQRILAFSILEYLNRLEVLNTIANREYPEEHAAPTPGSSDDISLILAIEEPELYQHPQRCRHLHRLLTALTSNSKTQIIFTTHSPYFIDINRYYQIRIIHKEPVTGDVCESKATCCSIDAVRGEAARVLAMNPGDITPQSVISRSSPIMDTTVNEGFFSRLVVLVEGLSDMVCLWSVQELLNKNWSEKGIWVVPVRGKTSIGWPLLIFRSFNIPTYFIFDGDNRYRNSEPEKKNNIVKVNKILQKLGGVEQPLEFPSTTVSDTWACFDDKLETTIKLEIGEENYQRLLANVKEELGFEGRDDVLKNSEAVELFLTYAGKDELRLPTLEAMVEKISSLID